VEPKWCLKEPFSKGSLRHLYRFFEELFKEMVLLKNPGLKGSLRHLYRFFEELFKEMDLERTLV